MKKTPSRSSSTSNLPRSASGVALMPVSSCADEQSIDETSSAPGGPPVPARGVKASPTLTASSKPLVTTCAIADGAGVEAVSEARDAEVYFVRRVQELEATIFEQKMALESSKQRELALHRTIDGFKKINEELYSRADKNKQVAKEAKESEAALRDQVLALKDEVEALRGQVAQYARFCSEERQHPTAIKVAKSRDDELTAMKEELDMKTAELAGLYATVQQLSRASTSGAMLSIEKARAAAVSGGSNESFAKRELDRQVEMMQQGSVGGSSSVGMPLASPAWLVRHNAMLSQRISELEAQLASTQPRLF